MPGIVWRPRFQEALSNRHQAVQSKGSSGNSPLDLDLLQPGELGLCRADPVPGSRRD